MYTFEVFYFHLIDKLVQIVISYRGTVFFSIEFKAIVN